MVWLVDRAEPIALILALIAWGYELRKQRSGNRNRDIARTIRDLSSERFDAVDDYIRFLSKLRDAHRHSSSQRWPASAREELNELDLGFFREDGRLRELLRLLGRLAVESNDVQVSPDVVQSLRLLADPVFAGSYEISRARCGAAEFQVLLTVLAEQLPGPARSSGVGATLDNSVHDALRCLWISHGGHARELLAQSLYVLLSKGHTECVLELVNQKAPQAFRSVLRHPQLQPYAEPGRVLSEYVTSRPLVGSNPRTSSLCSPDLKAWLKQAELSSHPFGSNVAEEDTNLVEGWTNPENWCSFLKPRHVIANVPTQGDGELIALYYCEHLALEGSSAFWPIRVLLPARFHHLSSEILQMGVRASARQWCNLLSEQPEIYQELRHRDQYAVAEMLCWWLGTPVLPFADGKSQTRDRDLDYRTHLEWLQWRLADIYSKSAGLHKDALAQEIRSLAVRPPRCERVSLVVIARSAGCLPAVDYLIDHAANFRESNIDLKILWPDTAGTVNDPLMPMRRLTWREDDLMASLESRCRAASTSKPSKDLRSLFEALPPAEQHGLDKLLQRFIRTADGSLALLLDRGRCLVNRHLAHPTQEPITLDILKAYVQELETHDS